MDLDTSPSELNAAEHQAAQARRREELRLRARALKRRAWTGMVVAVNLVAVGAVVAQFAAPAGAAVVIGGLVLLCVIAFWLSFHAHIGPEATANIPSCEAGPDPFSSAPMAEEPPAPGAAAAAEKHQG